jgi:hypothetical protein
MILGKEITLEMRSVSKNVSGNEQCLIPMSFFGGNSPTPPQKKHHPAPATHHQRQETMSASMALAYSAGVNN